MTHEVMGPDGVVHKFDDNATAQEIDAEMARRYKTNPGGTFKPMGAQSAGQATPASGAIMPGMQAQPPYMSAEDEELMATKMLFPHAGDLLTKTPGHAQRMKEGEKTGENMANLKERQRQGLIALNLLDMLRGIAAEGQQQGTLESAIGPLDQNMLWQTVRGATPGIGHYYEKSYNLAKRLDHAKHALGTHFAKTGGGGATDAQSAKFDNTMGAMMGATNWNDFNRIAHDAEQFLRETYGLVPGQHTPPNQGSSVFAQPTPPQRQLTGPVYTNPKSGQMIQWDGKDWIDLKTGKPATP